MKSRIFYTKPSITELEVSYAADAARNGWGDRCYEYIGRFEDLFLKFTKARFAIATSSCTGALHMGLAALDIGPGDEVILADTNWIATAAPITYLGAKPIFVDILSDTWCIDPQCVEEAISVRTKAIIAVHLYGNVCEMDKLQEISEAYNIPIVEDAAEAIGSYWRGNHAGTMGKFGAFSFHGTKTLTTGEGGMFITEDESLYEKVLTLSNHGRSRNQIKQFWPDLIGYKYKMSNIQAAIGCAQIERVGELIHRKREIFRYYAENLLKSQYIAMNPEKPHTINSYWMPTVVFDPVTGVTREKLQESLINENIDARVFFWPLSSLPMFKYERANHNSYDIPTRSINLPSYHDLTFENQDRVISALNEVLNNAN
jgi:perosamine synthetase